MNDFSQEVPKPEVLIEQSDVYLEDQTRKEVEKPGFFRRLLGTPEKVQRALMFGVAGGGLGAVASFGSLALHIHNNPHLHEITTPLDVQHPQTIAVLASAAVMGVAALAKGIHSYFTGADYP